MVRGLLRRSLLTLTVAGLAAPAVLARTQNDWAAVGQYGDKTAPLTVFERDGALHIDGEGFKSARLTLLSEDCYAIAGGGKLTLEKGAVRLDGKVLAFHDFGAETQAAIRKAVRAAPARPGRLAAGRERTSLAGRSD